MGTRKDIAIRCAFLVLAGLCGAGPIWASEQARDPDEEFLVDAKVAVDGKSLIQFLETHSPTDLDPQNVEPLIRNLAAPSFENREKATKDLLRMGLPALAPLREALRQQDAELIRRAEQCVAKLERDPTWRFYPPVVRLLVKRKAEGATEALLRFLPYAVGEDLQEEIWYGLDALALKDGAVRPALIAALKDASPVRRAVAACILGRLGDARQKDMVRKLLADPNPIVRLRAAQGLLAAKEKTGIPVLVDLLTAPSVEIAWQAEELLRWVAGEGAPDTVVGAKNGLGCRKAWGKWWETHQSDLDFADIEKRPSRPGLYFLCEWENGGSKPLKLWTCGCDGFPRWELPVSDSFLWADLLPSGRLLTQETTTPNTNGILIGSPIVLSERNPDGKTITSATAPYTTRFDDTRVLPNGDLLVSQQRELKYWALQTSPSGKTIFSREFTVPDAEIKSAHVTTSGNIVCVCQKDQQLFLADFDPWSGRETRKTEVRGDSQWLFSVQSLDNDHYLVIEALGKRVSEFDRGGQRVWHLDVARALGATRLRCGNTLIEYVEPEGAVCELTRGGKTVWEAVPENSHHYLQGRPWSALIRFGFGWGADDADMNMVAFRKQALRSRRAAIRRRAASALAALGSRAEIAIPDLVETLLDSDTSVRGQAAGSLIRMGHSGITALVAALEDKREELRLEAAEALLFVPGQKTKTVPILIRSLKDTPPDIRIRISRILARLGPDASLAVPDLRLTLKSQEIEVRREVVQALSAIGPTAMDAVPDLVVALSENDELLRRESLWALGSIAPQDDRVKSAVLRCLKDKDFMSVRAAAARIIELKSLHLAEAVPALAKNLERARLNGFDRVLFWATAGALASMGEAAAAAVPALTQGLGDHNLGISERRSVLAALAKIGPAAKKAVPTIVALMNTNRESISFTRTCIETLGSIGPGAEDAVPSLQAVTADRNLDDTLRREAAFALGRIGPAAKNTVPTLIEIISREEESASLQESCIKALGTLGRHSSWAVPALNKTLEHPDPRLRTAAAQAIKAIKADN